MQRRFLGVVSKAQIARVGSGIYHNPTILASYFYINAVTNHSKTRWLLTKETVIFLVYRSVGWQEDYLRLQCGCTGTVFIGL